MFVYQPTLDKLELKKYKDIDYALSWKSKVLERKTNKKDKSFYQFEIFVEKINVY